jgi:hypothetical protein
MDGLLFIVPYPNLRASDVSPATNPEPQATIFRRADRPS